MTTPDPSDEALERHLEKLKKDFPQVHQVILAVLGESRKRGEILEQTLDELRKGREEPFFLGGERMDTVPILPTSNDYAEITKYPTHSDHIVDATKKVKPIGFISQDTIDGLNAGKRVDSWLIPLNNKDPDYSHINIPIYAHPAPPSDLVQAAESAERLLSELVAYGFETNEDYDVLDNLRAALKAK